MPAEIEDDEKIAGKKWRLDRAQPTRMSNCLKPFRLKRAKTLLTELTLCAPFGKWQSVYRIPPLAIRKGARYTLGGLTGSGESRDRHGTPCFNLNESPPLRRQYPG